MSSLIPGYEYDIFISYRQKDNKHDGWVTEFVNNLKGELESTFKEEISVYFDINPHDGLLETHDVNASLKEKLKCLVFIPIISQTYCDPKSFAWEHELKAFVEHASQDQFGLKIKLPGGNVASRILPIKIHDLDAEDKALLENELGGVLRSIEFIYNTSGVNRPLKPNDERTENLNRTYYRDQINKVANAIKEIISAIKKYDQQDGDVSKKTIKEKPEKSKYLKPKIIIVSVAVLTLIVLGYFIISKLTENSVSIEKTIAVLPFRNLSNDTTQLYFCDGFMEDILNNLQKVESFTVRPRTSSFQYRDTKKPTAIIGKELNVNYLVGGSVGRDGSNLRIRVYLINPKADKQMWSNDYTREKNQLFSLQSEIAKEIASELKAVLTDEEIKKIEKKPTENLEAYNYYLQGRYSYSKTGDSGDNSTAINLYEKAIGLDPRFPLAFTGIAECLIDQYWYYRDHRENILLKSKQALDRALEIDPDLLEAHYVLGKYYYQGYLNYPEALKQFDLVLKYQPNNTGSILYKAAVYRRSGNWDLAKSEYEKAIKLDPGRSDNANEVGETYDLLRDYSKAEEYYNMSIMLMPDWTFPYHHLSQMFLRWKGDTGKAREVLGNASMNNKKSLSDSLVIETYFLIDIYEGKYEEALKDISLLKHDVVQNQFYFRPKYLYYANIYGWMKKPKLERAYYDSTRIYLEKRIIAFPEDQRLYSSLGLAYAGLGLVDKAISAGEKAVNLIPVSKEAYKGPFLVEDLARIYVIVGKYDEAIKQIKYLLSIPGLLSTKILELDPRWAPLRNLPEFKKMMEAIPENK
jgi:TolB-like protein